MGYATHTKHIENNKQMLTQIDPNNIKQSTKGIFVIL